MTVSVSERNRAAFDRVMRERGPLNSELLDYLDDSGVTNPNFCSMPIIGVDCSEIVKLSKSEKILKCTVISTYENYKWFNYILMEIK